jgi:hypothetical protein
MKFPRTLVAVSALAAAAFGAAALAQDDGQAEMMKKWKTVAAPGPQHRLLDTMIGEWETTTTMARMPATKGTAKYEWILGGRFVEGRTTGSFMGGPMETRDYWGFDTYKKHYTRMGIATWGTNMLVSDGKAERDGKAIHFYGRMDEWLDGTLKNVRHTLRFDGPDRMVSEIYDLDIGEKDNMVFTIEYRRKK